MRLSRLLALVAFALVVRAHAAGPTYDPAALPATDAARRDFLAQIESVGRRGFLYEVAKAGARRLFLYGTIHLGRVGSEPFNGPVLASLRAASRLALEADPTDTDRTQVLTLALGGYGPDDDLRRHVSPALFERVVAFGERRRLPTERLARLKPWLLANVVALSDFSDHGLDPAMGSELYLAGFARAMGLPIVEIEGMEPQLRLLADLPDALQVAQLDEALADAASGDARSQSAELFALWKDGRREAGDALLAEMRRDAEGKPFERYFLTTIVDARNRAMADRAVLLLDEPGDTFFAVGCLHLFGPTGLLDEFARRGYRVVDLQTEGRPR